MRQVVLQHAVCSMHKQKPLTWFYKVVVSAKARGAMTPNHAIDTIACELFTLYNSEIHIVHITNNDIVTEDEVADLGWLNNYCTSILSHGNSATTIIFIQLRTLHHAKNTMFLIT